MLSERLQILISPEQRRRLDARANEEQKSVGRLVREAIDTQYRRRKPTREERLAAVERIKARQIKGPLPSAEELDRLYERGIEERLRRAGTERGD